MGKAYISLVNTPFGLFCEMLLASSWMVILDDNGSCYLVALSDNVDVFVYLPSFYFVYLCWKQKP